MRSRIFEHDKSSDRLESFLSLLCICFSIQWPSSFMIESKMRSVDHAYRICSTARLSIWDILCEKTDQRNADFLWVISDHSVPLLPKHILKIMALLNSILDSRYVEQTGALALSLFNASSYCASWGSHDIPLAITSLLASRVGIHSEASERDFQLMLCLVSREFKTNIYDFIF